MLHKVSDGTETGATAAGEASNDKQIVIVEFKGPFVPAPGILDQNAGSDNSSLNTSHPTGTTGTQFQSGNLSVGFVALSNTAPTFSAWSNGYTEVLDQAGTYNRFGIAVDVLAGTGTTTTTGTSSTDAISVGLIATFMQDDGTWRAAGTPSIDQVTSSGNAKKKQTASGTPSIEAIASSSTTNLGPKVWLNSTATLSGATEMTVTSFNSAGTSITFTDPSGAPTGSLQLGVENRNNGGGEANTSWIQPPQKRQVVLLS